MTPATKNAVRVLRRIRRHLLTQRKRASAGDTCTYRTSMRDSAKTCAVGCLVPKECYRREAEGASVNGLTAGRGKWSSYSGMSACEALAEMLNASKIPPSKTMLAALSAAQEIHDHCPVSEWKRAMDALILRAQEGQLR